MNAKNGLMIYHWYIRYDSPDNIGKLILSHYAYDFPIDENGKVKNGVYKPPEFNSDIETNLITYMNGNIVRYLSKNSITKLSIDFLDNVYSLSNIDRHEKGKILNNEVDTDTNLITSITYQIQVLERI